MDNTSETAVEMPAPHELNSAAFAGNLSAVLDLLARGADINDRDFGGQTPLMWAGAKHHPGVAAVLIAHGADPDEKDNRGCTALIWAAQVGEIDTTRLLIGTGASPHEKNNDGKTALDIAQERNHAELAGILKAAMADCSVKEAQLRREAVVARQQQLQKARPKLILRRTP